jgi:ABC-type transporter Mla subunit MlaD
MRLRKNATHDKRRSALGDAIAGADSYAANINEARKAGHQELHRALNELAARVKALEGAKKP